MGWIEKRYIIWRLGLLLEVSKPSACTAKSLVGLQHCQDLKTCAQGWNHSTGAELNVPACERSVLSNWTLAVTACRSSKSEGRHSGSAISVLRIHRRQRIVVYTYYNQFAKYSTTIDRQIWKNIWECVKMEKGTSLNGLPLPTRSPILAPWLDVAEINAPGESTTAFAYIFDTYDHHRIQIPALKIIFASPHRNMKKQDTTSSSNVGVLFSVTYGRASLCLRRMSTAHGNFSGLACPLSD